MGSLYKTLLSTTIVLFGVLIAEMPENLTKKVLKEITNTFETNQFELVMLDIPNELDAQLPASMQRNMRRIDSQGALLGFAYTGSARSKSANFEYLILFDKQVRIVHSKVLVYREEYGGEIGSKRWLRQFNGKGGQDRVSVHTNIDAISGATISVRSMTIAVDKILQSVAVLQDKEII